MTLEEKLAQIVGLWVGQGDGEVVAPLQDAMLGETPPAFEDVRRARLGPPDPGVRHPPGRRRSTGALACGTRSAGWCSKTRLGIPALVHEECLTGLGGLAGGDLPDAAGLGRQLRPRARRADGRR